MTQLTYNEAFDPYHAAFRFFRLMFACDFSTAVPFDMFRILDFYLLYPFRLQNMTLLSEDIDWRKVSRAYEATAPYGELPDDNSLFARMEPFQRAAATSLAHTGCLSLDAWERNQIAFLKVDFPTPLVDRCVSLNDKMSDIVRILCDMKQRYPLLGRGGLKDRTGLMEFRYDSI